MTTTELLVGTFVLLSMLAIAFWFGFFVGLHRLFIAEKKRIFKGYPGSGKTLDNKDEPVFVNNTEELKEEKNDRSNL